MREEGRTENTSRRWQAHVPRQPRRRGRRWPRRRRRAAPPAPRNPLADRREGRRVAVGAPKRRHSPGGRAAELTLLPTADDATHLSHPHTASLSRGGERRGSTYDTYSTVHQHLVHICEWSHADRKRTGGEQHHHHVCAQGLSCHGRSRQPRRRTPRGVGAAQARWRAGTLRGSRGGHVAGRVRTRPPLTVDNVADATLPLGGRGHGESLKSTFPAAAPGAPVRSWRKWAPSASGSTVALGYVLLASGRGPTQCARRTVHAPAQPRTARQRPLQSA